MLETPKDLYTLVIIRNHSNNFKYITTFALTSKAKVDNQQETKNNTLFCKSRILRDYT